ncbi:MAG: hypothetical protein J6U71_02060 [Bacteroidales bacterium]|nr:hypothetical protein [Bacteroidales bacterium]
MELNMTTQVYNLVKGRLQDLDYKKALLNGLNTKISSSDYSAEKKQSMQAEAYELKRSLAMSADDIIRDANKLIDGLLDDVERENRLDPAQITEDIKLLQPGIILRQEDIEAILERNKDNKTMVQIALRYADEHKISPKGTYYIGGQQEREEAKALESTLDIYRKYIPQENASVMLDKFFGVYGVSGEDNE